ncbi:MAG: hypothetical protein IJJ84_04530, partial [Kiritimatiellae bacterium]|nr:hypothetical protein [Kiritimatiellia bacterium]
DDFYKRLCFSGDRKKTPYSELDPRHLQLLWRVLNSYPKKSLNEVLKDVDKSGNLESIARCANLEMIGRLLNGEIRDVPLTSPSAQVMFNSFEMEG